MLRKFEKSLGVAFGVSHLAGVSLSSLATREVLGLTLEAINKFARDSIIALFICFFVLTLHGEACTMWVA